MNGSNDNRRRDEPSTQVTYRWNWKSAIFIILVSLGITALAARFHDLQPTFATILGMLSLMALFTGVAELLRWGDRS
jgi:hypothetical protein